ncbi:MAG TPA: RDD family protein [Steroidobacteraceae bacterium]|nr:RDD family protein [Steroidobacteraceae bacterium]
MNTNLFKSFRCWALLLCCMLLTAAHAQDVAPPPAPGTTTTFESAAPGKDHDAAADHDDDDGWSSSSDDDTESSDHHHLRHRHSHAHSNDVVSIGRKAELSAGEHADSVVAIFGSSTSAGDVDDAVVSVLGSSRVTGGRVGDSAVAVMGSVYVNAEVKGDVVAVLGNVELGPEAKVHGDVIVVGGELTRDPKAIVDGHVQNVLGVEWADFDWVRPWVQRCLLYGRPLAFAPGLGWAWGIALGLLALYVFIAFVFRGAVDKCVHTLETQAGHSILAALLLTLAIPVLFVLLFITVLGIAAVPFLAIAILCAAVFGKVVVLAAIGRRCTPMLANDPTMHTVVGVLVGGAIVMVIYTIPLVGFIVYKLLELLGLGVVVYTLLLSVRAGRLARAGGPGTGGGGRTTGPGPGGGPSGAAGLGGSGGAAGPGGGAMGLGGNTTRASADAASDAAGGASAAGPGPPDPNASAPGASMGRGQGFTFRSSSEDDAMASDFTAGNSTPPPRDPPASGFTSPPQPPLNLTALPRAGFGIRMGALLLDVVLIGILLNQLHERTNVELLALATYGAVMWKLKGSTVGGIICGLQVVRIDGRPIDWPTAIVRALGCFLSLAVVGLGFIWIAIDSDRQSWHDKIAGTVVVRAPKGSSLL